MSVEPIDQVDPLDTGFPVRFCRSIEPHEAHLWPAGGFRCLGVLEAPVVLQHVHSAEAAKHRAEHTQSEAEKIAALFARVEQPMYWCSGCEKPFPCIEDGDGNSIATHTFVVSQLGWIYEPYVVGSEKDYKIGSVICPDCQVQETVKEFD